MTDRKHNIFGVIPTDKVGWRSPSNIALVKYWGKKSGQIPANASLSLSLKESVSETIITFSPAKEKDFKIDFYLDNEIQEQFSKKIKTYLESILHSMPFIAQLDFKIESKNTFPHSAGIASSASGISAIALCLCDIERKYFDKDSSEEKFFQRASYFARLGSGSAARSIYGGISLWGEVEGIRSSSNKFAINIDKDSDDIYKSFHDSILIVDSSEKKVSSSLGHSLMTNNTYATNRFLQANENIKTILKILKTGDLKSFINIVESEALTLHSMMMTSNPYFILMKPNTISIIEKIWEFRKETDVPVCFTLDAGPNVHILYPDPFEQKVKSFIESELLKFTYNNVVIHDNVGNGPEKIV
mgnify:CR=1 FL=1